MWFTVSNRDYLANTGVYSIVDRPRIERIARDRDSPVLAALFDLKERARETNAAILPEPQAALLTGILLGDDSGLPQSVKDDIRATGTSNIIAISGYNFAVLIALASVPAARLFGRSAGEGKCAPLDVILSRAAEAPNEVRGCEESLR